MIALKENTSELPLVDEVVTVEVGAICSEMLGLYQVDGVIAEIRKASWRRAISVLRVSSRARRLRPIRSRPLPRRARGSAFG